MLDFLINGRYAGVNPASLTNAMRSRASLLAYGA